MRSVAILIVGFYAVIGLVFFATSLYLYISGTDSKAAWRFNNAVIWLVVVSGVAIVLGSLVMTLTGTSL